MEFPLPDELIESIFDDLDVPSLLRSMQVCKLFYSIISESTHFIYKIELFASCMDDNKYSKIEIADRLNLLREYNRKWNDLDWSSSGSIPMADGCWVFSGGILAQVIDEDEISLVQLPCEFKGVPERRWSISFDFAIRDFALDNSQDLVVLTELLGTSPPNVSYNIHLRTLSGERHPRAAGTQITYSSPDLGATIFFLMQICGDRVAILFCDRLFFDLDPWSTNPLLVWNWQTGKQELYIRTMGMTSYTFMTEDLILAAVVKPDSEPTLKILKVSAHVNPIHALEEIPCVCELQLPQVEGDYVAEWLLIRSDPTPTWKPPAGSAAPFYASRKDCIFSINIRLIHTENGTEENAVLFVPLSILLSEVERSHDIPRRTVPWDTWGPNGTRMISVHPSETWICYTYGMKFIQCIPGEHYHGSTAQVYDFNPYAARRHHDVETNVDSPRSWDRLVEDSEPKPAYWQDKGFYGSKRVVTRLPGRVATVTLPFSSDRHAAMIGEDHVVFVQHGSARYAYTTM